MNRPLLPAPRSLLLLATLALAGVLAGCTSRPQPAGAPDFGVAATRIATSQLVMPVLANNPGYEPALVALAAGIEGAIILDRGVTPESVRALVDAVGGKYDLDEKTRVLAAAAILDFYDLYAETYKGGVIDASDPRVLRYLQAFRDGVQTGIARYHALKRGAGG